MNNKQQTSLLGLGGGVGYNFQLNGNRDFEQLYAKETIQSYTFFSSSSPVSLCGRIMASWPLLLQSGFHHPATITVACTWYATKLTCSRRRPTSTSSVCSSSLSSLNEGGGPATQHIGLSPRPLPFLSAVNKQWPHQSNAEGRGVPRKAYLHYLAQRGRLLSSPARSEGGAVVQPLFISEDSYTLTTILAPLLPQSRCSSSVPSCLSPRDRSSCSLVSWAGEPWDT